MRPSPAAAFVLQLSTSFRQRTSRGPLGGVGCMDPLYYTLIGCFAAFGGLAVGWLGGPVVGCVPFAGRPRPALNRRRRIASAEEFNRETESTHRLRDQERRGQAQREKNQALAKERTWNTASAADGRKNVRDSSSSYRRRSCTRSTALAVSKAGVAARTLERTRVGPTWSPAVCRNMKKTFGNVARRRRVASWRRPFRNYASEHTANSTVAPWICL